jgi:hypothetical protein
MSAAAMEELLARLYTDDALRRRFLSAPEETARQAGLDAEEAQAFAAIDRGDLGLAAQSYAHKRAAHAGRRRRWLGFWQANRLRFSGIS